MGMCRRTVQITHFKLLVNQKWKHCVPLLIICRNMCCWQWRNVSWFMGSSKLLLGRLSMMFCRFYLPDFAGWDADRRWWAHHADPRWGAGLHEERGEAGGYLWGRSTQEPLGHPPSDGRARPAPAASELAGLWADSADSGVRLSDAGSHQQPASERGVDGRSGPAVQSCAEGPQPILRKRWCLKYNNILFTIVQIPF